MSCIIGCYNLFVKRSVKNDYYLLWLIHKADIRSHIPCSLFCSLYYQAKIKERKGKIYTNSGQTSLFLSVLFETFHLLFC